MCGSSPSQSFPAPSSFCISNPLPPQTHTVSAAPMVTNTPQKQTLTKNQKKKLKKKMMKKALQESSHVTDENISEDYPEKEGLSIVLGHHQGEKVKGLQLQGRGYSVLC